MREGNERGPSGFPYCEQEATVTLDSGSNTDS